MTPPDLDTIIKLIQGVGFPVAVAMFVLVRLDRSVRDLTKAINELILFLKARP